MQGSSFRASVATSQTTAPGLMAVWQWYKGIAPKTRIFIGLGVMAYAGAGMFLSDRVEEKMGFVPTDKDKEDLQKAIPKITVVDRKER